MKISERCKKQIEDMERLANELKMTGKFEPYQVVAWDRDFESISELYIAYKSTIDQLEDITKLYHEANDYIDDFEESEDRCATLEAENNSLRNTIKNMKENFTEHLNALEAENEKLKHKIEELKCCNGNQGRTICMLREANDSQFNQIKAYKDKLFTKEEEIRKLYEKVAQLHTIKKSFEVLRALYLGDYENDEPF